MQWTDLAAIAAIVGVLLSCATAYLRLFVAEQLAQQERRQREWLEENYQTKAVVNVRFENLESRVDRLEAVHNG